MHLVGRYLTVIFAVMLIACAATSPGTATFGDTWAILPLSAQWMSDIGANWVPSAEQVLAARDAARRRIISDTQGLGPRRLDAWHSSSAQEILHSWRSYRLQAYGHTDHGRRLIRLSFITLDSPNDTDWRHQFYIVMDGGSAYWQADYDPQTKTILWWEPNGVA